MSNAVCRARGKVLVSDMHAIEKYLRSGRAQIMEDPYGTGH